MKCGLRADSVKARSACTPNVDRGVREPDGPCTALTALPSFDAWTRWGCFDPAQTNLIAHRMRQDCLPAKTDIGPGGAGW